MSETTSAWAYPEVGGDLVRVVVSREAIEQRLTELAAQIDRDYAGREILLVGVLKGAAMVMSDLMRLLRSDVSMDWMAVSSYGAGTQSSARPRRFAFFASTLLPVSIRSSAAAGPISAGRRSMPPQPGTMPSMTSGSASLVPGSSTTMR